MAREFGISRRAVLAGGAVAGAGVVVGQAPAYAGGGRVEQEVVDAVAVRMERGLVALRRDLHRHPEASGEERRTAGVVAGRLRRAGLRVTTGVGGHGVVGVLDGALPGRTVAYRADMDAVRPSDQIGGGDEVAHVCGHDLHTTVGVGVAEVLARLRHRLEGRVVFLFQPGEESLSGARAMIEAGVLERERPQEIHALHCGPFPVGQFAVTPGTGLPGQDRGVFVLRGADAAERAKRVAEAVLGLSTVEVPDTPAGFERLVREIQTPDGPLSRFVTVRARVGEAEGAVEVRASYRCWPEERYLEVRGVFRRIGEAHAAEVQFPNEPFPAMVCPRRDAKALERRLRKVLGPEEVTELHAAIPFSGEDFALFLDHLPGTFTFLGVRAPGADITKCYPHFGSFDPDERAIGVGVRAMAGWLAERAR